MQRSAATSIMIMSALYVEKYIQFQLPFAFILEQIPRILEQRRREQIVESRRDDAWIRRRVEGEGLRCAHPECCLS